MRPSSTSPTLLLQLVLLLLNSDLAVSSGRDPPQSCFEPGECLDSFVIGVGLRDSPKQCLEYCLETEGCQYFTHYEHDRTCLALGNCMDFSSGSCQDCVTGNQNCTLHEGPSILLTIGGHGAEQNWRTVQAIDLSGEERNCFQPREFPWKLEDGQGFTVDGKPVVCGGLRELGDERAFVKNCTIYDPSTDEWSYLASTAEERTYAGTIQLDEGRFWITGGFDEDLNRQITTEIFSNGAFTPGPDLPEPLTSHCMARLNETHVSVTGGWGDNSSAVLSAYLFDLETKTWTRLGDTIYEHYWHGCGTVDVGDGPTLMITGGQFMYETEIYHFSNDSWTFQAKSFLPHERAFNPSLTFENSVLLVGGFDFEDQSHLDTLLEFNGEREIWMERKEKLSFPRSELTAILVDEDIVSCT